MPHRHAASTLISPLCTPLILILFAVTGCGKTDPSSPAATASTDQPQTVPEEKRVPEQLKAIPAQVAEGKSEEALKTLASWIAEHPQDPRGYTLRAGVHAQTAKREAAVADLNKAVELSPNDADILHSRGLFYLMHGPQASAKPDFEQALKLDPKQHEAANLLGLLKLSAGEFASSIKDFDLAIATNPNSHSYYNNRGLAHWRAGNPDLARADFDSALKVKPQDANALSNRGQLSLQQKKFEAAVADFTSAIAVDPYNMTHYRFRHAAYLKLGRLVDAENNGRHIVWLRKLFQLQEEIRKQPGNNRLLVRLGQHFAEEHDDVTALKVFNGILKKSPNELSALLGRAQVLMHNQDFQQVVNDCNTVLQLQPSSYDAHSLRGDAWFQLRKYDEAIADFEAAQRFDRMVSDAYSLRSQQRAAAGDRAGADADLAKSKQMAPKLQTADAVE